MSPHFSFWKLFSFSRAKTCLHVSLACFSVFLRLCMNSLWNHFFSIWKFQIKWKLPQQEYLHTAVLLEAPTPPRPQIHKTRIHLLPKQVQPVQKQDKPLRLRPRQQPLVLQQSALKHLVCWLDCTDSKWTTRENLFLISSHSMDEGLVINPSLLACHLFLKSLASAAVLIREISRLITC